MDKTEKTNTAEDTAAAESVEELRRAVNALAGRMNALEAKLERQAAKTTKQDKRNA